MPRHTTPGRESITWLHEELALITHSKLSPNRGGSVEIVNLFIFFFCPYKCIHASLFYAVVCDTGRGPCENHVKHSSWYGRLSSLSNSGVPILRSVFHASIVISEISRTKIISAVISEISNRIWEPGMTPLKILQQSSSLCKNLYKFGRIN